MTVNPRYRIPVSVLVMLLLFAMTCFSLENPYHLSQAAGKLSMSDCLRCHDIGSKKPIAVCLGDNCLYSKSHSLMHEYPPFAKQHEYAPLSEVERAGCIIENGKMTCLSCHDLTKPAPHLIRSGDKLCLICHLDMTFR